MASSTRQFKIFGAVHPSAAIEREYESDLKNNIKQMMYESDVLISKYYQSAVNRANDASSSKSINDDLVKIERKYHKSFAELSQKAARQFTNSILYQSDMALQKLLNRANLRVKFQMTDQMKNITQSIISENVSLIKSIPNDFFTDIQSIVNVGVQNGRDQQYIYEHIKQKYGVTNRRASLIARDQTNKATSALTRARQKSIGIQKGIWQHSHAGKKPRQSHVAASGKEFDLDRGLYLDGEWLLPAQAINCRCTWRPRIDFESMI